MRLSIKELKRHPFFSKIDWKQAEDGKLKVPPPVKRPISKSFLPMAYDSEDEEDDNSVKENEERFEDQQFSNNGGGEEYHYDEAEENWVPKTMQAGKTGALLKDSTDKEDGYTVHNQ